MEKLRITAENSKTPSTEQNFMFYWVFNPDGTVIDYSKYNYSSLLENNYIPATSSKSYLGE